MPVEQGPHHRSTQKQATYKYPLWSTQKQATCEVISWSTPKVADAFPKKRAVPLPTATPHLQQSLGCSGTQMKSCLNPAATPGEPHSSASPRPTSPPPPNNHEQPTNPHRVTLVSTPGPPTSSPMKEPLTPGRNNPWDEPQSISAEAGHSPTNPHAAQKKHPLTQLQQTSKLGGVSEIHKTPLSISGLTLGQESNVTEMIWNLKLRPRTPKELVGTDHPASCPLDATLRNTTPTRTNYAARTNLAPPNPTNEEGPATFATSAGIRARSWEDLRSPPANRTTKKTKAPDPLGTVKDSKVRPPIPIRRTSQPQTKENPYTPGWKFRESNSITPPQNAMELHWRTPTTPAEPREPSLRCPAPSQQTPGLASTDRH
ncbi:hypothetical protein J132_01627 [Termitomyces sp. J132]|nr:hypothetical protein J132_01627 [Termitomyces sp. J132]